MLKLISGVYDENLDCLNINQLIVWRSINMSKYALRKISFRDLKRILREHRQDLIQEDKDWVHARQIYAGQTDMMTP